jgi:hypothetical protein
MSLDATHIGILLGASEWRMTADPKPVRLDRDFPHISGKNPNYAADPEEIAPDLDTVGVAFLERLRPLVSQLQHKIEFKPDEALFEVVLWFCARRLRPRGLDHRIPDSSGTQLGATGRPVFFARVSPSYTRPKTRAEDPVEVRYQSPSAQEPSLQQLIQETIRRSITCRVENQIFKLLEEIDQARPTKQFPRMLRISCAPPCRLLPESPNSSSAP